MLAVGADTPRAALAATHATHAAHATCTEEARAAGVMLWRHLRQAASRRSSDQWVQHAVATTNECNECTTNLFPYPHDTRPMFGCLAAHNHGSAHGGPSQLHHMHCEANANENPIVKTRCVPECALAFAQGPTPHSLPCSLSHGCAPVGGRSVLQRPWSHEGSGGCDLGWHGTDFRGGVWGR